jgi:hypothetical protein
MSGLFDKIREMIADMLPRFADNKNVKWIQTGENTWEAIVKVPPARSESSAEYAGPFAVVKKDDTTVTLQGYNADKDRYCYNPLILGLKTYDVAERDISVSASAWIYMKITYDGSDYQLAFSAETGFKDQTATEFYIPLAYVKCGGDGKITDIIQLQYGNIIHPGRVL